MTEEVLLKTMKMLNRVGVSKANLDKMTDVLMNIRLKTEYSPDNVSLYITVLDYMIQNYFEIIQESRRRAGANSDIDAIEDRERIYRAIQSILLHANDFTKTNLLSGYNFFETMESYSIKANMFQDSSDFYNGARTLKVLSPFIDTSSERGAPIEVQITSSKLQQDPNSFITVLWAFALELEKEPGNSFFASNIVKVNIFNKNNHEEEESFQKQDNLKIKFPLRIEPAKKDLNNHVKCARFKPRVKASHEFDFSK
jgi:hypothetical protein